MKSKKLLCILTLSTMIFHGSLISNVNAQTVSTHRISGQTRYDTSVAISEKGWTQSDTVILANGEKFADALCAGPLAKKYNAPILLIPSTSIGNNTLNELARLQVKNIIIVGGNGSVSLNVESQLKSSGYSNIDRISGKDRYETSVMIAQRLDKTDKVIIASSEKFPDALSISPIASKLGIPILLSNKDALSEDAKQFIQSNNIKKTYIVGGKGVLSDAMEKSVPSPIRLSGSDRYGTNAAVMKEFERDLSFDQVYMAMGDGQTGDEFADALSGAVLASNTAAPILLTYKSIDDAVNEYIKSKLNINTKAIALGGQAVVPDELIKTIMDEKADISIAKDYNKAGTYSDGDIDGSVIISESGVYLKNTTIEGDLLIASTVGDGTVDLDNVTVKGKTIINGGGSHNIHYHNVNGANILIDKPLGEEVGITADENTSISSIVVQSNSVLDQSKSAKNSNITVEQNVNLKLIGKFENVEIKGQEANVDIQNASINTLNVNDSAKNAVVSLDKNSKINKLTLNTEAVVKGEGTIESAFINVNGITLEQKPTNMHIASGVSAIVKGIKETGTKSASGGGGGGSLVVQYKIVTSSAIIGDIDVAAGTTLGAISLPQNVGIGLNDGSTTSAAVTWDGGNPVYNGSIAGTYLFTGNLTLPQGIINPDNKQASVKVVVRENGEGIEDKTVISAVPIADINVVTGTTLGAISLPESVDIILDNGSTTSAAVTWNDSSPAYNGNTLETYNFIGTITLPQGVINPKNKQTFVRVIVVPKISSHFEALGLLAKDNEGNIYVTDAANNKVQKFSSDGNLIKEWGTKGSGDGQFVNPRGIAVDSSSGDVYVLDTDNSRVQKFNSNGEFISKWGNWGYGNGQFRYPRGIAVDSSSGNVYVVDADNNRIQKFNSDGNFQGALGSWGSGDGQFKYPAGIVVDSWGNIYVADGDNDRIQKFNSSGDFLIKWGNTGSGNSQFQRPSGIALDNSGNVYVVDTYNHRIQEFNSNGGFITSWGSAGQNSGQFICPTGVVVDNSGDIYISDIYTSRIQKFKSDTTFEKQWYPGDSGKCEFKYPVGIALDRSGNIYVCDIGNSNVQKIDSNGATIRAWGGYGSGTSYSAPSGVAIDSLGNIYTIDTYRNEVQKFNSDGNLITKWGSWGSSNGQFNYPQSIAVDSFGNVYVADTDNNRIQKFKSDGTFIIQWGSEGSDNGQFNRPYGVAVDASDNVYVVDTYNNRVQKFDSSGKFLTKWGTLGATNGKMYVPSGIAVDTSGNVYVVDVGNSNVQKFDSNGVFIKKYGTLGSGNGQLYMPYGVAIDSKGNIYVVDSGNNRIQIFTP
ncbi:cell wall-binding repeat-containing protein [Clostridium magnum]|uniref:N-acetylmuramoyl-L-alanine amidase LytC n=1 Tax=Clostridium magnum DSM 2767 TaxID=1121326 RepID=A0A162RDG3_9CLOT|nr:cell wall-binding repeat-containing protein [Clostridium magnum]KZL89743.1 N-acetylmuramoyl-L-alanine amidase LytC precursor [Clostridium magnum DSM 2767]SHH65505.1 Putative cell wall-binding protein [Clostridium magnum DSM 2767]